MNICVQWNALYETRSGRLI